MSRRTMYGIFATLAMAIIILDTKTVIYGVQEGIQLCLQTIIPALFPFIILSGIISSTLLGQNIKIMHPIRKLCHIPQGAESILLLGLLGGYPVGAQIIAQAYSAGSISKNTAKRMLGFCSNAGPAFMFGMFSVIFSQPAVSWILWAIHIFSALTVGFLLPKEPESACKIQRVKPITLQASLTNTIKTISLICGWVIVFRIIIRLCEKWFLWKLSNDAQIVLSGFLELSNGCISLTKLPSEATRFLYASGILSFGGLCVGMQTKSVTQDLGSGYYFPGKILQTMIALLYSLIILPVTYKNIEMKVYWSAFLALISMIGVMIYLIYRKKLWHLQKECCIIPIKKARKEQIYAVSKENAPFL